MHPRPPGRHIGIDSQLLILSFELKFFVCRHVSMRGFQNRVCPYPEKRNHLSFVNISPTLVIDTSMERFSRVLHHGNPKIGFLFPKKFEIEFDLYFDLCQRAESSSRPNMHLYVDIGDASSSLRGSTLVVVYSSINKIPYLLLSST